MAEVVTQGNEILIETPSTGVDGAQAPQPVGSSLIAWLLTRARRWEEFRDNGYAKQWREYWNVWRGRWDTEARTRLSERSKLIAPALSQAIEQAAAEVEEAIFGKEVWFDIPDDSQDKDKIDSYIARDLLHEDLDRVQIQQVVSEAITNGAIFGTSIIKLNVEVRGSEDVVRDNSGNLIVDQRKRVYVVPEAVRPDKFIPDPVATTVSEGLGAFQKATVSLHSVLEKIERGTYLKSALSDLRGGDVQKNADIDPNDPQSSLLHRENEDEVVVLDYHGKVPKNLLEDAGRARSTRLIDQILDQPTAAGQTRDAVSTLDDTGPMVEAIVTFTETGTLLRAMENPFIRSDRSFIAAPWEKVPGRFWGRGVAEKGINPQRALDAEIRARIDALGYLSAPMIGVDMSRLAPDTRASVGPGKIWKTLGNPNEVLSPITMGTLQAGTFEQTQEMERMVQMGTGAFDTATPLRQQSQSGANGASSNSGLMGAFVKRTKRAIRNLNGDLLDPLIRKSMWRYMEFAPSRYPQDFVFKVKPTLGIVAREVEAAQLTQTLGMMPEQFGNVSLSIVQGIIENTALSNKGEILQQIQQALAPPSEEEQARQKEIRELEFENLKAQLVNQSIENQKLLAEIREILSKSNLNDNKAEVADDQVAVEKARVGLQAEENQLFADQNAVARQRVELQERALEQRARQQ